MAKLTREDVLKLAKLAKLELTDKEVDSFTKEISEILNYVEQLQSVNIKDTKPTYQVTGLTNVTRSDVIKEYQATRTDLLKNLPQREGNLIKVKRVLQ
jgi:aspartyl-tRNA(Asn)/glutamyl-tRNA(Gln) amidotransferase subunit C